MTDAEKIDEIKNILKKLSSYLIDYHAPFDDALDGDYISNALDGHAWEDLAETIDKISLVISPRHSIKETSGK